MSDLTRREFTQVTLGGAAGLAIAPRFVFSAPKIDSKVAGVQLGVQSYSFRTMDLDAAIAAMVEIGIGSCELWSGHVEPRVERGAAGGREKVREWRLTTPLKHFEDIGRKFADAGVEVYAYNYSFRDDFTDEEMARGFEMAKALGAKAITASSNVSTAARIGPMANNYRMKVGVHNHSQIRENEFATPDDFQKAMDLAKSDYVVINLDIGHFTAANFDAVDYLKTHHGKVVTLHIKDRKKNQGENLPFGQGDTPIKQVLALLKANKWPIPANIEYEYKGEDTKTEVRRCLEYCRQALLT
jgi:sugar phosphate isomerase/epimerase